MTHPRGTNAQRRLDALERQAAPAPRIVMCWDIDPAPAPPGVKVVTWPADEADTCPLQPEDIVWRVIYDSVPHGEAQ